MTEDVGDDSEEEEEMVEEVSTRRVLHPGEIPPAATPHYATIDGLSLSPKLANTPPQAVVPAKVNTSIPVQLGITGLEPNGMMEHNIEMDEVEHMDGELTEQESELSDGESESAYTMTDQSLSEASSTDDQGEGQRSEPLGDGEQDGDLGPHGDGNNQHEDEGELANQDELETEPDQSEDDGGEGEEELDPLDNVEEESSEAPPVVDLPYLDQFILLTDLSETSTPYANLVPANMDVDRWEIVISPQEYLQRFHDQLELIRIVDRAPTRRLHTTYHRGPAFDRWLLLGEGIHEIWVALGYKDAFFRALNQYQIVEPGRFPHQASLGHAMVSTAVFIHCLTINTDCDAIRIKAYGQKMPLIPLFLRSEPAQEAHRWAVHNEWDIGTTFTSQHIWLFASRTGRRHGIRQY